MILITNKPRSLIKNIITATGHIITISTTDCDVKTSIIRAKLLHHFPIVFAFKSKGNNRSYEIQVKYLYKPVLNVNSIGALKSSLYENVFRQ